MPAPTLTRWRQIVLHVGVIAKHLARIGIELRGIYRAIVTKP